MSYRVALVIGDLLAIWLVSCTLSQQRTPQPTINSEVATLETQLTAMGEEDFCCQDCTFQTIALAWIDLNGDGVKDEDEPPLEGVDFIVNDTLNQLDDVAESNPTAFDGRTTLYVWLPGCPDVSFEIFPVVPDGYEVTTELPVEAGTPSYISQGHYKFGFYPLSAAVLPTPRPLRYECTTYNFPSDELIELQTGPDGTLWAADIYHLFYFDLEQDKWIPIERDIAHEMDGDVWGDILFLSDGSVWLHGLSTGYLYRDNEYHFYKEDSLQAVAVPPIARTSDGTLWFVPVHLNGRVPLYAYQPSSDQWTIYIYEGADGIHEHTVFDREAAYSPVIGDWLLQTDPNDAISAGLVPDPLNWQLATVEFERTDFVESPYTGDIFSAATSPDGMLWLADSRGVVRFNPASGQWTHYDAYEQGINQFYEARDITIAPDGSIWIVSGDRFGIAIQIVPLSADTNEAEWYVYDGRDGIANFSELRSVAASADGSIWMTGFAHEGSISTEISRCQPVTP